jgi:hypothetical protein
MSDLLRAGQLFLRATALAFLFFGVAGPVAARGVASWPVIRLSHHRLRRMLRAKGGLVMPDLWVFDAKGRLVFRFAGDHRDLIPSLARVLAHPAPIRGPHLSEWLNARQVDRLLRREPKKGLIFMELWASWNPACWRERKALMRFIAARKNQSIRGILLAVDAVSMPARRPGTVVRPGEPSP